MIVFFIIPTCLGATYWITNLRISPVWRQVAPIDMWCCFFDPGGKNKFCSFVVYGSPEKVVKPTFSIVNFQNFLKILSEQQDFRRKIFHQRYPILNALVESSVKLTRTYSTLHSAYTHNPFLCEPIDIPN